MSGRVGDLNPKQKEALAKVSSHPGPAPAAARSWSSPSGGSQPGRRWVGGERRSPAGGLQREQQRRHLADHVPPLLPLPAEGARRSLATPARTPRQPLEISLGRSGCSKWKPLEAAQGTKTTFIVGTGSRALGAGAGPPGLFSFPGGFPLAGAVAPGKGRCTAP